MKTTTSLFSGSKPVIGVINVGALPGTPKGSQSVGELVRSAREEAKVYREGGVDGIIIENMHDVPYLKGEVGPEIVAAMTAFSTGARPATVMDRIAKGFSETETKAIADWYAAQK